MFDENIKTGYTAAEFHPDGLILGTGTADSSIYIWEARQEKVCLNRICSASLARALSYCVDQQRSAELGTACSCTALLHRSTSCRNVSFGVEASVRSEPKESVWLKL